MEMRLVFLRSKEIAYIWHVPVTENGAAERTKAATDETKT